MTRVCGECRACCTALAIKALDKPHHTRCEHECDRGCAIYDDGRPQECVDFECGWLVDTDHFRHMERPDKTGIILYRSGPTDEFVRLAGFQPYVAFETRPRAAAEPNAQRMLRRVGRYVVVVVRPCGDGEELRGRTDQQVYGPEPYRSNALRVLQRGLRRL